MPKFKFICDNSFYEGELNETTKEFSAESLDEVLTEFEMFLSGCGYYIKGNLEIVDDEIYHDNEDPGCEGYEFYDDTLSDAINQYYSEDNMNNQSMNQETVTITGSSYKD